MARRTVPIEIHVEAVGTTIGRGCEYLVAQIVDVGERVVVADAEVRIRKIETIRSRRADSGVDAVAARAGEEIDLFVGIVLVGLPHEIRAPDRRVVQQNLGTLSRADAVTAVGGPVDRRMTILRFLTDEQVARIGAEGHRPLAARGVGIEPKLRFVGSRRRIVDIQHADPTNAEFRQAFVDRVGGSARGEFVALLRHERIGRIVPRQRDASRGGRAQIGMPDQLSVSGLQAREEQGERKCESFHKACRFSVCDR